VGQDTERRLIPTWPDFTNLVQEEDGTYKQTGQITEISACLGAAIKRANTNLILKDSFPGIEEQEEWLVDALRFELNARSQSCIIDVVGERAKTDINYFNCLLSMVRMPRCVFPRLAVAHGFQTRNRWSSYRQTALNMARDLVGTRTKGKCSEKENQKSSYGISGSDAEKVAAAAKLLDQDAFHFGRTSNVSATRFVPKA